MTNDERDKMIRETHGAVVALKAAHSADQKRLDRISTVIGGNGTEGLVSRVSRIEGSRKEERRPPGLVATTSAALLVAVIAGVVVALVGT